MPISPDQERSAEALAVTRMHDDRALAFLAERIGALTLVGDVAGVARWEEIVRRINALECVPLTPQ